MGSLRKEKVMRKSTTSETVTGIINLVYTAQTQGPIADVTLDSYLNEMFLNGTIFKCTGGNLKDLAVIIDKAFAGRDDGIKYNFLDRLLAIANGLGAYYVRKIVHMLYPKCTTNEPSAPDSITESTTSETTGQDSETEVTPLDPNNTQYWTL